MILVNLHLCFVLTVVFLYFNVNICMFVYLGEYLIVVLLNRNKEDTTLIINDVINILGYNGTTYTFVVISIIDYLKSKNEFVCRKKMNNSVFDSNGLIYLCENNHFQNNVQWNCKNCYIIILKKHYKNIVKNLSRFDWNLEKCLKNNKSLFHFELLDKSNLNKNKNIYPYGITKKFIRKLFENKKEIINKFDIFWNAKTETKINIRSDVEIIKWDNNKQIVTFNGHLVKHIMDTEYKLYLKVIAKEKIRFLDNKKIIISKSYMLYCM